jgi:hypothetical protein
LPGQGCSGAGFSEGQRQAGARGVEDAAEIRLDAFECRRVVGLEAQHDHRRGVRRPRQAEAVGVLDAQAVDGDDLARVGEAWRARSSSISAKGSPSCMPMFSSGVELLSGKL